MSSQRIQIIVDDSLVAVDGKSLIVNFNIDQNIWAVQWYGTSGHIEYRDGTVAEFSDFSDFSGVLDAYNDAAAEIPPSELHSRQNDGTWVLDLDKCKAAQALKVKKSYEDSREFVDCSCSDGKTYRMDAGIDHASRMDQGYRLAIDNNEPTMIVRDYYNRNHLDIPLAIANEIRMKQSLDARDNHWIRLAILQEQINAVEVPEGGTVEDAVAILDGITW